MATAQQKLEYKTEIMELKARFDALIAKLELFGFKGEVYINSGIVIVNCHDKNSAKLIRKGIKGFIDKGIASNGSFTEVRTEKAAMFLFVDNDIAMSKKELKELAMAA